MVKELMNDFINNEINKVIEYRTQLMNGWNEWIEWVDEWMNEWMQLAIMVP